MQKTINGIEVVFDERPGKAFYEAACPSDNCKAKGDNKKTLCLKVATGYYKCLRCGLQGIDGQPITPAPETTNEPQTSGRLDGDYVTSMHAALFMPIGKQALEYLYSRGLSEATCRSYKLGFNPRHNAIALPNLDFNGSAISIKYRSLNPDADPKYFQESLGGERQLPYGCWRNKRSSDELIVTEGEIDALSMAQLFPERDVIGIPGMNSLPKSKALDEAGILTLFDRYKTVYLIPDSEMRSRLLFHKYASVIDRKRCRVVTIDPLFKDCNECLVAGVTRDVFSEWFLDVDRDSKPFTMISEEFAESKAWLDQAGSQASLKTSLESLDRGLAGLEPGRLTLLAGAAKSGKSTIAGQISFEALKQGAPVLFGSYEMSLSREVIPRMVSLADGKNYLLRENHQYYPATPPKILKRFVPLNPGVKSIRVEDTRHAINAVYRQKNLANFPVVLAIIDNLSRYRSQTPLKTSSDYIQFTEATIIELKNLTREFPNLHLIVLCHLTKRGSEDQLSKNLIRGSAVVAAESDSIVLVEGNKSGGATVLVDAVRSLNGNQGVKFDIEYDRDTTRVREVTGEDEY